MRVEDINLSERSYFNASGKTKHSRRWVALSQRVLDLLFLRCGGRQDGWVCRQSAANQVTSRQSRKSSGRREMLRACASLVLYAARHTYGTFVYETTKNLQLVMNSMGHGSVRTTMRYQHHDRLEPVRNAIDQRNL